MQNISKNGTGKILRENLVVAYWPFFFHLCLGCDTLNQVVTFTGGRTNMAGLGGWWRSWFFMAHGSDLVAMGSQSLFWVLDVFWWPSASPLRCFFGSQVANPAAFSVEAQLSTIQKLRAEAVDCHLCLKGFSHIPSVPSIFAHLEPKYPFLFGLTP